MATNAASQPAERRRHREHDRRGVYEGAGEPGAGSRLPDTEFHRPVRLGGCTALTPFDLIETARGLTELSPRRPTQANLRRAVSTAYYAMFHCLASSAANLLIGGRRGTAWHQVYHTLHEAPFRPRRRNFSRGLRKRGITEWYGTAPWLTRRSTDPTTSGRRDTQDSGGMIKYRIHLILAALLSYEPGPPQSKVVTVIGDPEPALGLLVTRGLRRRSLLPTGIQHIVREAGKASIGIQVLR